MDAALFQTPFVIPETSPTLPAASLCPSDLPLALLPVRLETRFFTLANGATELRVRIFPDKIHLDSHERDLTADERTWGEHYWQQNWLAGNDPAVSANAWRQIANRFGARRAAWIARVLQPVNQTSRPTLPTPPGQPLSVTPQFPATAVAKQADAWRQAPHARLLPDRFIAVLHSAGKVALTVTSKDVRKLLAVGPNPQAAALSAEAEAAVKRGELLAIDGDMKWMVDFDEAESAGMAMRITVPSATLAAGLDSLVVFGVCAFLTGAQAANQLADLFDAHHYTDGLGFLQPGTPTNNTEERRTGYGSDDPGHERSFALEVAPTPALNDSNASRVGAALGIPVARILPTFGHVERGLAQDDLDSRSMNTALWQVGWGYFLNNMVGAEAGLKTADVDWARRHFLDHVRGFGPLPVLRCGAQPYGLLPVTSLDLWQPGSAESVSSQDSWLKSMLLSLRDNIWRTAAGAVARIGNRQNPPDPDADLADVMRSDAVSHSYRARNVLGRHFLQHLQRFLGSDFPVADPAQSALLQRLALPWRPRLSHLWSAGWQWNILAPLIQAGEVSPWTKLEPNYITALLNERSIDKLILARPSPEPADPTVASGTSLLQLLLRHALLREIADAAARLTANQTGADLASLLRDAELIDLVDGAPPIMHWKRQLDTKLVSSGGRTVRQVLEAETSFTAAPLVALGELRKCLARLAKLDSASLLQLMESTLDLSAHRLDAWVTSIATKRLAAMHQNAATGLRVGAYGWVENLRPVPPSLVRQVPTLPPGEPGPLQTPANDSGFIHAPSMTHGATAALLRNSHLGPTGVPKASGPFAIDLSSRRAREAARLLQGVRQGQPLGALLGYRLERTLHETFVDNGRSMDRFIAPLRRLAPLVIRANADTTGAAETIAANNVVDGLVLHRRWKETPQLVLAELAKETFGTSDLSTLTTLLNRLDDAIDGLSDALTAESAYQLARGNTLRAASTLAAIAQGDAPPPELEVTRMPRSGTSLTHRLLALMSGTANLNTPGWLAFGAGSRSVAEPLLNFWASKLLGDASKVRCTIERIDESTGSVSETRTLHLNALAITPLDVIYGVEVANTTAQPGSSLSEIEQLVLYHAKHDAGGFAPFAQLRLQHTRPANLAAGEITLFDLLEQARVVRRLLAVARGAEPEDLNPPERISKATIDLAELEARVVRAENGLNAAHKALKALIAQVGTAATAESLRSALLKLGAFGIGPSVPVSAAGTEPASIAALARQGQALLQISATNLDRGAALRALPVALEARARREQLVSRMRAVFGASFVVLPRFSLNSEAATEFGSALAATVPLQGGDPFAVNTWFSRCARVRDSVGRFESCLQRAEVLGTLTRLNLGVAQLPFVSGERWVALPPLSGTTLPPSKLSLVVQNLGALNPSEVMTGLLVDEWLEIVPNAQETTALTFQFDAPDACAPQSVLLAVPPIPGKDWTAELLRRVLMETLDLAKLRAVDTGSLGSAAQFLPGLYLAFNIEDHAVSTDLASLTR